LATKSINYRDTLNSGFIRDAIFSIAMNKMIHKPVEQFTEGEDII